MKVQDVFFITGRGFVITTILGEDNVIKVGNSVDVGDSKDYVVTGIERFHNAFGPSKNVGILIRGELENDKNSYSGKDIIIK